MTAAALAVATPHYQWYSLLLVMLVALDGRPEWLAFAAGGYYAAYPDWVGGTPRPGLEDAIAYGVPLVMVAVGWLIRHELARRAGIGEPQLPEQQNRWSPRGSRCSTSARTSCPLSRGARSWPAKSRGKSGSDVPAGIRRFLTGWLPARQTSNGTDHQDRE